MNSEKLPDNSLDNKQARVIAISNKQLGQLEEFAKQRSVLDTNTLDWLLQSAPHTRLGQCRNALNNQILPQVQGRTKAIQHAPGQQWDLRMQRLEFLKRPTLPHRFALGRHLLKTGRNRECIHLIRPVLHRALQSFFDGQSVRQYDLYESIHQLGLAYQQLNRTGDQRTLRDIQRVLFRNAKNFKQPGKYNMPPFDKSQRIDLRLRAGENLHNLEALTILIALTKDTSIEIANREQRLQYLKARQVEVMEKLEDLELPLAYPYYGIQTAHK